LGAEILKTYEPTKNCAIFFLPKRALKTKCIAAKWHRSPEDRKKESGAAGFDSLLI